MTLPDEWTCAAADIAPGTTIKLKITRAGKNVDAFVVNFGGTFHAYVNRCPHVGTPLDLWPNEFLSEDGSLLVCATHGAVFEPGTGRCIGGPCVDDRLTSLAVSREGDRIVVRAG